MSSRSQTNEQRIATAEIRDAVANLLKICEKNHAAAIGFVFGVNPPLLIQLINVKERGPALTELFVRLCDLSEEQTAAGNVTEDHIR